MYIHIIASFFGILRLEKRYCCDINSMASFPADRAGGWNVWRQGPQGLRGGSHGVHAVCR